MTLIAMKSTIYGIKYFFFTASRYYGEFCIEKMWTQYTASHKYMPLQPYHYASQVIRHVASLS